MSFSKGPMHHKIISHVMTFSIDHLNTEAKPVIHAIVH
jgi:hypothetical protein